MRFGIVAGEVSGDILAAGLIHAIKSRFPEAQFEGIAGPLMIEAECQALFPLERLSVMGIVEVLGRYRELLGIRASLARHFIANPPDVFIGVDAPDFNLGLEKKLKVCGIPTVHYVSPSVWAWRQGRVKKIARSTDLMLTLFPFEADFYREHHMPVRFVGHPLADQIPLQTDAAQARAALGLPQDQTVVAVLPGSRVSELKYLAQPFVQTMQWCAASRPDLHFVVPLVNPVTRDIFMQALQQAPELNRVTLLDGQSHQAMAAADVVLLASGTAALEGLLLKRPMVVAYRVSAFTAWLAKRLLKVPYVSLPNNLAGEMLVEEYLQDAAVPEKLGPAVLRLLEQPQASQRLIDRFDAIHRDLRRDASNSAAEAVLGLVGR